MLLSFLSKNGWSEGKWRTLIEEEREYDVIGAVETKWHDSVVRSEGGWTVIGRGRQAGEKKGRGVGVIMREKEGRNIEEVKLTRRWKVRLVTIREI